MNPNHIDNSRVARKPKLAWQAKQGDEDRRICGRVRIQI